MGAPKQKWTTEEESALKAGVAKHGSGKWRTILTDPEFSSILRLRSNVDLKDKWRNINVMISGLGSRSKARLALKKNLPSQKHHDNRQQASSTVLQSDEVLDPQSLAVSASPKEPIARLDKVILDSIRQLNEPGGSDKASIAMFIEEQCHTEPDFKKKLTAKLKHLAANGKLMKVKHKYKIKKRVTSSETRRSSLMYPLEGRKQNTRSEIGEFSQRTRSQIDEELSKMRSMTPEEAAAAAAQAVAEAEVAIAEAAEAARKAEEAEAEAESADIFFKAALQALKSKTLRSC